MKKFSFMIAFFAGVATFCWLKAPSDEYEGPRAYIEQRKAAGTDGLAFIFASVASIIVYFGIKDLTKTFTKQGE